MALFYSTLGYQQIHLRDRSRKDSCIVKILYSSCAVCSCQRHRKLTMLHLRCNCGNVSGRSEESRWSSCWGFPGSSKIWLHKWSWWSFPTAHIASLQPPHMHPQIDTLIANIRICISSNPSLSFQDKKDRAQTRRCCTAGFFSQTSHALFHAEMA